MLDDHGECIDGSGRVVAFAVNSRLITLAVQAVESRVGAKQRCLVLRSRGIGGVEACRRGRCNCYEGPSEKADVATALKVDGAEGVRASRVSAAAWAGFGAASALDALSARLDGREGWSLGWLWAGSGRREIGDLERPSCDR